LATRMISCQNVRECIVNKFLESYGGLTCREVQWGRFGKAWDMSRPEGFEDFLQAKWPERLSQIRVRVAKVGKLF